MAHAEPASREQEVQFEMQQLSGRDLQLWLLGFLVLLVLAAGVIALALPNLRDNLGTLRAEGRYLPQLLLGLIALIVLFNAYLLEQRRRLTLARQELVRQLILNEKNEQLTLVDPLTQIFNRHYLEQIIPKEFSRAQRQDSALTLLLIDLDGFKAVNDGFGHLLGDKLLIEVAQLLQRTFRACDTVLRYGGDEFLVILPDTTEDQARYAVERLLNEVVCWNADPTREHRMSLSCGAAQYRKGEDIAEVLRRADQNMSVHKSRHQRRRERYAAAAV